MGTNKKTFVNSNIKLKPGGGLTNDPTDGLSVSDSVLSRGYFGDGSDGDVIISVNTSLYRDMYYNNLTINNGIILNPNGYRIYVKGTLNGSGKIARNGNNGTNGTDSTTTVVGSGGAGGTALSAGTIAGGLAGERGGDGGGDGRGGTSGSNLTSITTVNGVAGNAGKYIKILVS